LDEDDLREFALALDRPCGRSALSGEDSGRLVDEVRRLRYFAAEVGVFARGQPALAYLHRRALEALAVTEATAPERARGEEGQMDEELLRGIERELRHAAREVAPEDRSQRQKVDILVGNSMLVQAVPDLVAEIRRLQRENRRLAASRSR